MTRRQLPTIQSQWRGLAWFSDDDACRSVSMEVNGGPTMVWFFKISSSVLNIRDKLIQVWSNMRVSK